MTTAFTAKFYAPLLAFCLVLQACGASLPDSATEPPEDGGEGGGSGGGGDGGSGGGGDGGSGTDDGDGTDDGGGDGSGGGGDGGGDGSGGGDGGGDPEPPDTTAFPGDFLGEGALRIHAIDGDTGSHDVWLYREANGVSTVTVSSATKLIYFKTEEPGGQSIPLEYNSSSGLWEWSSYWPYKYTLIDKGAYQVLQIATNAGQVVHGGFGIETAEMPSGGIATYNGDGFARILLRPDGTPDTEGNIDVLNPGGVSLTVNYGNGNAVTGTVFDGSVLLDLDGDNDADDRLEMQINLSGTLSGSTFSGSVSGGTATFDINDDGAGIETATFSMSGTDADASFYGNNADVIGGTWDGGYSVNGSGASGDGDAIGYFDVGRDD